MDEKLFPNLESTEEFRMKISELEAEVKRLREGIENLPKNKIEKAQKIMIEINFVIDNLADRWQRLCFNFYTDICDMQTKIEELYKLVEKKQLILPDGSLPEPDLPEGMRSKKEEK